MLGKLILIIGLLIGGWWAYNNWEVKQVTICVSETEKEVPYNCETRQDCVNILTTKEISGYPSTTITTKIIDDHSICKMGRCYLQEFDFLANKENGCSSGEMLQQYGLTPKDIMKLRG
jgi:hypothetical protein